MAFRAKIPEGGLRAAVENNLRDRQQQQDLTLASETLRHDHEQTDQRREERFKTVELAAEDYEDADSSANNCPVSRAIRRALKKGPEVAIHVWVDRVRIDGKLYALPAEATEADAAWTSRQVQATLTFQLSNRRMAS